MKQAKKIISFLFLSFLIVAMTVMLVGCGSGKSDGDDGEGLSGACGKCETTSDCEGDLKCECFSLPGSSNCDEHFCADENTDTCEACCS